MAQQCQKRKTNGERCKAPSVGDSKFCFFHHPQKARDRKAAQRRGGFSRASRVLPADTTPKLPLKSPREVAELLSETVHQLRTGLIEPRISNAVGYLCGHLLKALEQSDIELRVAALETVLTRRKENANGQSNRRALA